MDHPPMRSYGRVKARALKPRQAGLVETLLPYLAVPEDGAIDLETLFTPSLEGRGQGEGESVERQHLEALRLGLAPPADDGAQPSPPSDAFGATSPPLGGRVLEIGFGGGEHLVAQATAHPEWGFIGVEPFLNGVGSCLRHIEESGVANVRLHHGDARDVIARLPDASLDRVDILFPDPWPKLRHHKRRLIQPEFLDALARVMKPGAELRFATDWANYAAWTLEHVTRHPRFVWTAERAQDWRAPWAGHVTTRYEQKKLGDCAPIWLRFLRA